MRTPGRVLSAVVVCSMLAVLVPAGQAQSQAPPPSNLTWQSAGDSYSSGEGILGNEGVCAQNEGAYGPTAADLLRTRGWRIDGETFTACTGQLVEDYFNTREGSAQSLWDWGRQQGGPERIDVITMSFGGNDIGFADTIFGCVMGTPDSWGSFLDKPACDAEDELNARIDALLDPQRRGCDGLRSNDSGLFDCDLALGGRRGSIIDFYYDVVTQRLTERGQLVIVGYPRLFADVDQWPGWVKVSCELVKRGDTEKLGRVAEHFNNKLQEAVRRANEALGAERVLFVDRFAAYRDGLHELCGTNGDWLNGVLFTRGQGIEIRQESSFHPNYDGHEGIAPLVADRLDTAFPRSVAVLEATPVSGGSDEVAVAFVHAVLFRGDPYPYAYDRSVADRAITEHGLANPDPAFSVHLYGECYLLGDVNVVCPVELDYGPGNLGGNAVFEVVLTSDGAAALSLGEAGPDPQVPVTYLVISMSELFG